MYNNFKVMAKYIEPEVNNNVTNHIGVGTQVEGNIISTGDIRIDGQLKGNLETKGKLVLGKTGSVEGEIKCKNSVVEGKIQGKIFVAELLSLKATSKIYGDITTNKLAIEPEAQFTGNCNMNSNVRIEKAEEKK